MPAAGSVTNLVDENEIGKFAQLAERWWDPDGPSRPLHDLNPARTRFVAERVSLAGTRVLDLGCGGGLLSESLAHAGARVTGVDAAGAAIEVARRHAEEQGLGIDYIEGTLTSEAVQALAPFPVVACMEMIEHVPDPGALIGALAESIGPGGSLFLSTLNRTPASWLAAIAGAEYLTGLIPRGTHDYGRFIRPSELARALRDAGFLVREVRGLGYNPVTRRAWVGGSTRVNYLLHAEREA